MRDSRIAISAARMAAMRSAKNGIGRKLPDDTLATITVPSALPLAIIVPVSFSEMAVAGNPWHSLSARILFIFPL